MVRRKGATKAGRALKLSSSSDLCGASAVGRRLWQRRQGSLSLSALLGVRSHFHDFLKVLFCGLDVALVERNKGELKPWLLPIGVGRCGFFVPAGRAIDIAFGEVDLAEVVEIFT